MRFGSKFSVSLQNLKYNFSLLRNFAPTNEVIFMVKADAYGHGLIEVAKFATEELKIRDLGVASLGEALCLKSEVDENTKIWIFSDTEIENDKYNLEYIDSNLLPVIHSYAQLEYVLSHPMLKSIPLNLKFDTGMNRLGIKATELDITLELLKKNNIKSLNHILTHFSESYFKIKNGDRTEIQYKEFVKIKNILKKENINFLGSSVSNSGAIEQKFGLDETHIRPGLMLYGPASVGSYKKSERLWFGKSLSSFSSKILKIEKLEKNSKIGYGGFVLKEDLLVAYLPIGYGDGLLNYYTGAIVKHINYSGNILGRVNMDMVAIGFPKEAIISEGDEVYIWSSDKDSILDFCNQVKSIPYQVFTSITQRVPKEYFK